MENHSAHTLDGQTCCYKGCHKQKKKKKGLGGSNTNSMTFLPSALLSADVKHHVLEKIFVTKQFREVMYVSKGGNFVSLI